MLDTFASSKTGEAFKNLTCGICLHWSLATRFWWWGPFHQSPILIFKEWGPIGANTNSYSFVFELFNREYIIYSTWRDCLAIQKIITFIEDVPLFHWNMELFDAEIQKYKITQRLTWGWRFPFSEDVRPAQDQQCHEEPHTKSGRNSKVYFHKDLLACNKRQKDKELNRKTKRQNYKKTKIQKYKKTKRKKDKKTKRQKDKKIIDQERI